MAKTGKVIASIEARLGSSRLPGKVLREIMGRPMIELLIERVRGAKCFDEIVLATTVNPQDEALEELAKRLGVKCYRGSEEDVLKRVLEAANSVGGDHIVELWGDNPLLDPKIIEHVLSYYLNNDFDCVGTTLDKNFPLGMSLLVFPTKVLKEVDAVSNDPVDRENVSNHIYEHPEKYAIGHVPCPPIWNRPDIRLTVDEIADFELIENIFKSLYPQNKYFGAGDIISFLDAHPELLVINKMVKQKKYRS